MFPNSGNAGACMDSEVIVLGANKRKAVWMLLASLAFVAAGVSMIVRGEQLVVAWLCTLFFGLGIPFSIYMLTPGASEMRIDRHGIEVKTLFKPTKIAWSDVNGFYVDYIRTGLSRTKMIAIEYSPSYQKHRAGRQVAEAMTGMQGGLPNHFNRPAEEVCALLNRAKKEWG
jgi:hypothetical protein